MALLPINVGFIVNDGTGDDLRTAFIKINQNFEELELRGGQANTISNIGSGVGLYKEKIGVDLRIKSIKAGPGISLVNGNTDITIENNRNVFVKINADTGSLNASSTSQEVNIVGGTGVTTSISGSTLTITGSYYDIELDPTPKLGGNLDLNGFDIDGGTGSRVTADLFIGDLEGTVNGNLIGLVNGVDVTNLQNTLFTLDFGSLSPIITNPIQLFFYMNVVDMGTFNNPEPATLEGGFFV